MKAGQTLQEYVVDGWVRVAISTEVKAFSREGAMKKVAKLNGEGLVGWDEHNWEGDITIVDAVVKGS